MAEGGSLQPDDETHEIKDQTERMSYMQVRNVSGGFVYVVTDMTRLLRFLILGTEEGNYYYEEKELKRESVECIDRLIIQDRGIEVVKKIVEVSKAGRACKQNCTVYALAVCARSNDLETKKAAYDALSDVCQIPTDLFAFIKYCEDFSAGTGWGRAHRRAIANWYNNYQGEETKLAYRVTKFRQRHNWKHKDALRLAHITPKTEPLRLIILYLVKGLNEAKRMQMPRQEKELETWQKVYIYLESVEKALHSTEESEVVDLIEKHGLVREHVPTVLLNSIPIWQALLKKMPMNAMAEVRNRLSTQVGVRHSTEVKERLLAEVGVRDSPEVRDSPSVEVGVRHSTEVKERLLAEIGVRDSSEVGDRHSTEVRRIERCLQSVNTCRPRLLSRLKIHENNVLLVQSSRSRITDIDQLEPGDHIAFHRPYVIWHHSIVIEVNVSDNTLKIINWQSENGTIGIIEQQIDVSKELGELYRIEYPSEILYENPRSLVISRARSRLGETGFHIFDENCESFATFCKTGISKSHQYIWLVAKTWEWLAHITVLTVRTAVVGFCALAKVAVNVAGSAVVIGLEGLILAWDVTKAYRERRMGHLSRNEYAKIAIRRVVDGLATMAFTMGGILLGVTLVHIGVVCTAPVLPWLLAGACGGAVGMTVGKVGGTMLGCCLGKAITRCFKSDDKAVDKITDLVPGDHVVLTRWALHPRCHGILIEHDGYTKMRLIRNKYKYGVVDEWVSFEKPLYRVTHMKSYSNEEALRRAKSQIGATRYNIATHNCKTFANWCKRRD